MFRGWWTLHCFRTKTHSSEGFPHHAQSSALHVAPPALTVYLSRLPWFSPWTRAVPREHIFWVEWEIIHSTRQRILVWEQLTLRSLVDRGLWLTQCVLHWLAQLALVPHLTQAQLARTDLPTYGTLATHDSHSLKDDDSILHTHHPCRTTRVAPVNSTACHIATSSHFWVAKGSSVRKRQRISVSETRGSMNTLRRRTTQRTTPWQEAAMKAFVMRVDTAQSIAQWCWRPPTSSRFNEPLRPDLTPRTINHEVAQCWAVEMGEARNEPRSCKLQQSDSEEEEEAPQPKRQLWEDQKREEWSKATRVRGPREKNIEDLEQWWIEPRRTKPTAGRRAKPTAGRSKANSRQDKSRANCRQEKSLVNSRQSKPKDCDRDKVKYEEKHLTEESWLQPASPEASKNRCRCPAGAIWAEAWRSVHDHPKDRLKRGNLEYKDPSFTVQKDTEVIHKEIKGGTKITCSTEGFGEEILGTQTFQTAQKQRLMKSRRPWSHMSEIVNVETHSLILKQMCDEVADWRADLSQFSS